MDEDGSLMYSKQSASATKNPECAAYGHASPAGVIVSYARRDRPANARVWSASDIGFTA
jgi:hypothetical protein